MSDRRRLPPVLQRFLHRFLPLVAALAAASPARADPSVAIVPLGFEAREFRGPASRVGQTAASTDSFRESRPPLAGPLVVVWGPEGGAALTLAAGSVAVRPARHGGGDFGALERGRNALAGSRVQSAGPITVQLEEQTRDYPHDALGSANHARVLAITERRPSPPTTEAKPVAAETTRIPAGEGAVFEDREPRLVDLDGDGVPEILVVRSYRDRGSALAIVARRDGRWRVVAETPPDGEPFRWLNPIVLGPGPKGPSGLFALVRRPHLDGTLQLWRLAKDTLTLVAERAGYANHVFGSAAQDLSAALPDEAGRGRLAIPTLDRRALAILSLGTTVEETARVPLPARAASGVAAMGSGADLHVLVGLEDGRVADLRP